MRNRFIKRVIYWLEYKGFYFIRKVSGCSVTYKNLLGDKYYLYKRGK